MLPEEPHAVGLKRIRTATAESALPVGECAYAAIPPLKQLSDELDLQNLLPWNRLVLTVEAPHGAWVGLALEPHRPEIP